MDILVSSNLERLLYHITGSDTQVAAWMADLAEKGSYTVNSTTLETIRADFAAGCASDEEVAQETRILQLPLKWPGNIRPPAKATTRWWC